MILKGTNAILFLLAFGFQCILTLFGRRVTSTGYVKPTESAWLAYFVVYSSLPALSHPGVAQLIENTEWYIYCRVLFRIPARRTLFSLELRRVYACCAVLSVIALRLFYMVNSEL